MGEILRVQHLLPDTSTPFEKALSSTSRRLETIPAPIEALWRHDECQPALLPWLAWALSVDIWDDAWPVEKKRSVIRRSFELHRIKGTLGGIRAYVDIAGSQLYRAVKPPAKNFLGASTTLAEKERLLASLPQIRIYLDKQHGAAGARSFYSRGRHRFYAVVPAKVQTKLQPRAIYFYNSISQEISWSRISETGERVFLKGTAGSGVFCGRTFGTSFYRKNTAAQRVITLDLDRTSVADQIIARFPVVPKMEPVDVVPLRVYEHGAAPRSVFCGTPIGARYFVPSGAIHRTYDAVHFKPPGTPGRGGQASNFFGSERFGMPAYNGELTISITGKRPRRAVGEFVGSGCWYAAPKEQITKTLAAVRSAKSARDDIRVNTKTYRPLTMGTTLLAGGRLIVGSFTRS